ncbi:hypothetical protein CF319_g6318 [Tilletia indica]|nr:hypothetical protein CF319_g6318 [Tilletia indica]
MNDNEAARENLSGTFRKRFMGTRANVRPKGPRSSAQSNVSSAAAGSDGGPNGFGPGHFDDSEDEEGGVDELGRKRTASGGGAGIPSEGSRSPIAGLLYGRWFEGMRARWIGY